MPQSGYDSIMDETRALQIKFEELVIPHRQALWNYCRYLTGSPWDGEDLFQETLMKAFATLAQIWHPLAIKSYLFRIATNTRIDGLRKKRLQTESYDPSDWEALHEEAAVDPSRMIEALEVLAQHLPPRQIAVLLLMEVYGFSASEVAGMVRLTEGAVYAALHRARANVRKSRTLQQDAEEAKREAVHAPLLDTLLEALRADDVNGILGLFEDSMHNDARPGFQEYSKEQMEEGSMRHRGPVLQVSLQLLWGREVFIVLAETAEHGLALHDVREFEFDGDRIVYHRGYYFCKELLLAAGRTLGMPVQLQKGPNLDWREAADSGADGRGE